MRFPSDEQVARVVTAALTLTRGNRDTTTAEIGAKARCSPEFVKTVLARLLGEISHERWTLTTANRLMLATKCGGLGGLDQVAGALTWQEFERLALECLSQAGYSSERNVRVKGGGRLWQIDVVGWKGPLLLCLDCKHWKPPSYLSKFDEAAAHQKKATRYLAESRKRESSAEISLAALPLVLTLHDPPKDIYRGAVLLSISKLPDFLEHVTPFTPRLPFLGSRAMLRENPIKQDQADVLGPG